MSDRSLARILIAVALLGYGLYVASLTLGMLLGRPSPLLLIAFALQTILALAAVFGIWRHQSWAATVVVLLGVSVAVTWLFEGFILGIVAYLYALFVAVFALVVAVIIAYFLTHEGEQRGHVSP